MHTVKPSDFIHQSLLCLPSTCPDCRHLFETGTGLVFNVPYIELRTQEQKWALICFCTPTCVLNWYPRTEMGSS